MGKKREGEITIVIIILLLMSHIYYHVVSCQCCIINIISKHKNTLSTLEKWLKVKDYGRRQVYKKV